MSAITMDAIPALAARTRLQVDQVTGEPVLLYPEGVLVLNETARDVVEQCDGKQTVSAVIAALASEYDASPEELALDVLECLGQLLERNLVVLR